MKRENERIEHYLNLPDEADQEYQTEEFGQYAADTALKSEVFTCSMRHLLYDFTNIRKADYGHCDFGGRYTSCR